MSSIVIECKDLKVFDALERIRTDYALELDFGLNKSDGISDGEILLRHENNEIRRFSVPVRIGHILDAIYTLKNRKAMSTGFKVGAYLFSSDTLDIVHENSGETVRLTEKERDILVFLHENGEAVSRDVLLKAVWGYADTVETHTIETHIYRLRQKIEDDPASPKVLITSDEGYILTQ